MFDHSLFSENFKQPGSDPRQWVSYGTVDADTPDSPSVQFSDDAGNPLPTGPLVSVTLQPSGISVVCRVGGEAAGNGEAEWMPFVAGDEVLVAIPEGHERSGPVILRRMNNAADAFPTAVAGMDPTKNTFAFRRLRVPYVIETGESYLIRSAKTGAQIGIDPTGNLILNDGDAGNMLMGPEAQGFTSGDGQTFMQLFPPSQEVYLGGGTATLLINPTESKFISQGAISFATSGGSPLGHAVSAEQVVAILINVLASLANQGAFTAGPLGPTYLAAPPSSCQNAIALVLGPALLALGAVAPVGPAPGGEFLEFSAATAPPLFGLAGALTVALSNPLVPVDPTGSILGFGKPGFKL